MKSFFKFLSRNRLYTFINLFGLSVSLMFVILIANYTVGELSTDNFQQHADDIYVIGNEEFTGNAYRLADHILSRYPDVKRICGVCLQDDQPVEAGSNKFNADIMLVDSTFLHMFSYRLLEGDRGVALESKNNILLSESFARKMFGTFNPIGQTIKAADSLYCTVTGIIENFDRTMLNSADIVMRFENMVYYNSNIINERMNNAGSVTLFVERNAGADLQSKAEDMAEYFKEFYWLYRNEVYKTVTITPMRDLYLSQTLDNDSNWHKGDRTLLSILSLVGLLILLFAVTNYINLTVAQTSFRAKEMASRRLLGSSKSGVVGRMIGESTLMCAVAFVIGLLLAAATEQDVNDLLSSHISVFGSLSAVWILSYVVLIVVLGVLSGVIPATVISRYKPIDVVKGNFSFRSKMLYSKIFITIQSVITIALLSACMVVTRQVNHLVNADLGYNHDSIIVIDNYLGATENTTVFRDKLLQLHCVEEVALTCGTPLNRGNNYTMNIEGMDDMVSFQVLTLDSAALEIFGLDFMHDNHLADEGGFWLTQSTLQRIGKTESDESFTQFWNGKPSGEFKIAGSVRDFRLGDMNSVFDEGQCCMVSVKADGTFYPWQIVVKVNGQREESFKAVGELYGQLTDGMEFTGQYYDSLIEQGYKTEQRTAKIMVIFAFIAVLISMLGLLAMATYFIKQREMEIAVRKVFGSTRSEILWRLIGRFMWLVIVAFVVACPLVWYAMHRWLEHFSYRISLSPFVFAAAGLFTLLMAFVTVWWQSSRAANANPADYIKS